MKSPSTDWARRRLGAVLGVLILGTVACSEAAPDPGPRFEDETTGGVAREVSCMQHQSQPPGTRYTDNEIRRTGETLALLRYYTANGTKSYCDGNGPTRIDRQWVDIYLRLGADRENVATLLEEG